MEGDCLDFKVLSAVVWGLLRKKVDDYTGQSPDEVYMMEVANAARIGALTISHQASTYVP